VRAVASEEKRKRLSELARRRPARRRDSPNARPVATGRRSAKRDARLEDLVPGAEERTARGVHWRHERVLAEASDVDAAARALQPSALPPPEQTFAECLGARGLSGALFLDLETCGFSGNPLFLTGLLTVADGRPVLTQLLARNYAEEASVVAATLEFLDRHPLVVTFNGKSYDLPFLRDRAALHGFRFREPEGHLDLLHAARRRWRDILPDCRLQTLEARFTGRRRAGDVPGAEVPERYHAFVREGAVAGLVPVLRHNLLDLVTLLAILGALPSAPPANGG
jgi:uncharacterized protein YprB with RNaseH-like and TPR domain